MKNYFVLPAFACSKLTNISVVFHDTPSTMWALLLS